MPNEKGADDITVTGALVERVRAYAPGRSEAVSHRRTQRLITELLERATEISTASATERERAGCRTARNADPVIIVLQLSVQKLDAD